VKLSILLLSLLASGGITLRVNIVPKKNKCEEDNFHLHRILNHHGKTRKVKLL
jgi:hypothetical protein